ncbi:MAG: saccharopine dehydrogenase NADP-binding domain-containing protein [Promethearchaeota archaeon]
MTRVIVLGGAGAVGRYSTKVLANSDLFDEVVIGDIDIEKAKEIAAELGSKVTAIKVNAMDSKSIKTAIEGSDVVLNMIGPYYKFEKVILTAVIESGIDYVDICDDTGATYDALALDGAAKKAGITALIGMGSSPGVTNLIASFCAKNLLKSCESIDIFHTHGGEPTEGAGVILHRFYCMRQDVPIFMNGKLKNLSQEESEKLAEEIEFINLKSDGKLKCYPYPHPEPITIPKFMKEVGLKRVTNKGCVLPTEYYDLTRKIFAAGLDGTEPVNVNGKIITPYDFAVSYLIKKRGEILNETSFGEPRGCVKIVVSGKNKEDLDRTYIFSLVSEGAGKGQAMGEGTGIPAALGTILMAQGKIKQKGVIAPEIGVPVMDFFELMKTTLKIDNKVKEKRSPILIQEIDEKGNEKFIELPV